MALSAARSGAAPCAEGCGRVSTRSFVHLQGGPRRRFRHRLKERPLLFLLVHALLNEIAVVHQFADQGIDLLLAQGSLRMPPQIASKR